MCSGLRPGVAASVLTSGGAQASLSAFSPLSPLILDLVAGRSHTPSREEAVRVRAAQRCLFARVSALPGPRGNDVVQSWHLHVFRNVQST